MLDRQDLKAFWELLNWQSNKAALADHAHLGRDALHIYAALLIFLGACWLFRWKASSIKPWLLVLLIQTINEAFDMRASFEDDGVIWIWGNIKDMVNTMIAPTLLVLAARYTAIFRKEPSGDKPEM